MQAMKLAFEIPIWDDSFYDARRSVIEAFFLFYSL